MDQPDFTSLKKELSGKDRVRNTLLLFLIILFLASAGYWASVTELDNVTRGNGEVTSASENQLVQAAEAGVILRRHVEENDVVKEGDLLFEIDPINAQAELDRTRTKLLSLKVREARLQSEVGLIAFEPATDFQALAPEIVRGELSLFQSRTTQMETEITILKQQKLQRDQELSKAKIRLSTASELAQLLNKELAVIEPLVREKIAPETRLFELQRSIQNNLGEQQAAESAIIQATSALAEIDLQISNVQDAYRLNALEELTQLTAELEQLNQIIPALEDRVSRTVVRAPMDGIVNRINFRTSQAYVKQGDVLVEMVPTGDNLIVKAKIAPQDISGIRVEDDVLIRLSSYDSSKYGSVDGKVTRISADAIVQQGSEDAGSFYWVDISVNSRVTLKTGKTVDLLPGMTATVDVLSGKRSVLEYIWQPMAKVQELALRD